MELFEGQNHWEKAAPMKTKFQIAFDLHLEADQEYASSETPTVSSTCFGNQLKRLLMNQFHKY
jgi:hypothetical protein